MDTFLDKRILNKNISIIFIGHGSRVQESNANIIKISNEFKNIYPEFRVDHCFIELEKPSFGQKIIEEISERRMFTYDNSSCFSFFLKAY